jgi:peptidoglycan/xylan/chitin deacetylase (PgdA/CDA1 family)
MIAPARWVCLMYHDVFPRGGPHIDYFAVPADRFSEHLSELKAGGWAGVSLRDALAQPHPRNVAITFDDATASQVDVALPLLLEHGMTATFFAITDRIGREGYASWQDLRALKAHGMDVQSHTHTHPFLSELDYDGVVAELTRSRALLDEQLGQTTTILALPGGDFPARRFQSAFAAAGYEAVATSIFGLNGWSKASAPRLIRRCTVRGDLDATGLRNILMHQPGLFLKRRLRESVLRNLRRGLGATRYARWRRRIVSMLGA